MKRIINILLALVLVLAFSLVATTPVAAATTYYVATTGNNAHAGTSWGTAWLTIQYAVSTAASDDTIMVAAGTYVETGQIVINKNLTIIGAGAGSTIVKKAENTGNPSSGNNRGWVLVNASYTLSMSDLTLDGVGKQISIAILSFGTTTVQGCEIKNIDWSAASYYGRGVCLYAGTANVVRNTVLSNIRRIGVFVFGTGVSALTEGNTYTGKGAIDCLDYGIEIGGGATATIRGNSISSCTGVASVDNSTSAGILVTDYFAPGTTATITGNTLTGNTEGIAVGYLTTDASVVAAHFNNFVGNTADGVGSTGPTVDATCNWWNAANGPGPVGPGGGDQVTGNVTYSPWLTEAYAPQKSVAAPGGTAYFNPDQGSIEQLAAVPTPPGAPVTLPYGMFSFQVCCFTGPVTLTIKLPGPVPAGSVWWKYQNGSWYSLPIGSNDGDDIITVTLTDNGQGDEDPTSGLIMDDGGPGAGGAVGWETYPISKVRVLLPWIALLAAIVAGATLLVLRQRRAQI